ncbi:hypothetical protein ABT298_19225 [Streptomyces sp. NPDC001034]|uniref:hypothetical protein n=1 Tax=Streptomyces sp. NPDC001034 TaxID=3154375 RepID=UPI00331B6101
MALIWGRLWAVEQGPAPANNDRRQPLDCWLALGWQRSPQVASGPRHFLRNKQAEWHEYRSEVTAFELRKNLPVL